MKSIFPIQEVLDWWIEVHTYFPKKTYKIGPFKSQEEARISRGNHVNSLYQEKKQSVIALIKQK